MKKIFLSISLAFLSTTVLAQGLDSKEFEQAKKQLKFSVDSLIKNKPLDDYNGGWIAKLEKEFYIDTFYIENLWQLEIRYNGSTLGMNEATHRAEQAYDKLLNKYYGKLLNAMQGEDKTKLKISQRNWIKFRDSEKEFNYTINKEKYNGGGTIHSLFVSGKRVELNKQRLFELYHYLDRLWEIKETK